MSDITYLRLQSDRDSGIYCSDTHWQASHWHGITTYSTVTN
jgi:hypothetical protein